MRVWFGEIEDAGTIRLAGRSIDEIVDFAWQLDSTDLPKCIDLAKLAIDVGLCSSREEYEKLAHETSMAIARKRINLSLSGRDAYTIQAVNALDEVNSSYNRITERLAEWYGIHFPELRVKPQELISLIIDFGTREFSNSPNAVTSIGAPLSDQDLKALRGLASIAQSLNNERKMLERYISSCMDDLAPNLSDVLGPILGARLIARAGGLKKLASMPSSTIQVMGAGEALFMHIRTGSPPPKHGMIYQHPFISGSPRRIRGKIARMLAGKVAIAARADFYSGEFLNLGQEAREKTEYLRKHTRRKGK